MSAYLSEFLCCAPHEMLLGVVRAAREVTRGEWELGAWLLAVDRSRAYEKAGFRSAVGFAIRRAGLEPHKASNLLRIAQALERLPLLAAAYQEGRIGYAKIREITRVADPETERSWLEFALSHTTDQVRQKLSCSPRTYELRAGSGQRDVLFLTRPDSSDCQTPPGDAGSPATKTRVPTPDYQTPPSDAGSPATKSWTPTPDDQTPPGDAELPATETRVPTTDCQTPPGDAGSPATKSRVPTPDRQTPPGDARWPATEKSVPVSVTAANLQTPTSAPSTSPTPSSLDSAEVRERPLFTEQPSSLPRPHFVHVAMDFTPEEYAEWQATRERLCRQFGRQLSYKEVVLELIRRHLATSPRSELERNPIVVRLDTDGQSFLETDRGHLPISPGRGHDYISRASTVVVRTATGRPEEFGEETDLSVVVLDRGRRRKLPADLIRALIARSGGRCESCGRAGLLHAHHRKPVARGGAHTLDNLTLLCVSCHGHTHQEDFKTGSPWAQARDRRRKEKPLHGPRPRPLARTSAPSAPNSS